MSESSKRKPYLFYFLAGSFVLFVGVLVVFAALWEDHGEFETQGGGTFSAFRGDSIGIVKVEGPIFYSDDVVEDLEGYRKNDHVKAIVIRIDSPGGGVAPSQEIYDEILRIREDQKPVVVSMGNLAASGGYYIASAADRIVANPGTLTGSIGVIMEFANFEELLGKIGVKARAITNSRGKFKDTGSATRPMTAEEEKYLHSLLDNVYEQFVQAVAYGRNLEPEAVYPFADGRVLSGEQAVDVGLVDELGGFERAVEVAADLAGIEGEPVRLYPREPVPSLWDLLSGDVEQTATKVFSKLGIGAPAARGGFYYLFVP